MKKIIALLLCCLLCLSLFAACTQEPEATQTESATESSAATTESSSQPETTEAEDEHAGHNHVNYKGLSTASATLEELSAAEGREPDFSFEAAGITYYAYNNVTLDSLNFTQVQASFAESYVRLSCTYTTDVGVGDIRDQWEEYMKELYGEPAALTEDGSVIRWADHTGNYVTLTILNESTVQLCYYLTA